jgi:hypothetical protein
MPLKGSKLARAASPIQSKPGLALGVVRPYSMAACMKSQFRVSLLSLFLAIFAAPLGAAPDPAPITPKAVITLFNGKDLSNFYTWLAKFGLEDPDHVFTVVDAIDGAPAIRISGQHYGGIITRSNYTNYRLVAEWRWGLLTWAPRKDRARDAGILLHGQGPDGNAAKNFQGPWFRSVEFQIIEGGVGDIILVNGYDHGSPTAIAPRLTAPVAANGKNWDPTGTPKEFNVGRIDWQYRDLGWKDVLGFRGARDVEKPPGEWNHIEAICEGGNVTYFVNGVNVMTGRDGSFTWGKLLFQSEGAEIFFRKIELHPLKP